MRTTGLVGPPLSGVLVGYLTLVGMDPVGTSPVLSALVAVTPAAVTAAAAGILVRRLAGLPDLLDLALTFPGPAPNRVLVTVRGLRRSRVVESTRVAVHGTAPDAAVSLVTLLSALGGADRSLLRRARRVAALTDLLARRLGVDEAGRTRLAWAALLCDIGKLTVAREILDNPGEPTQEEWELLRRHPLDGADMAGAVLGWLGPWGQAIRHHHERYDGAGYPDGLVGPRIPTSARIVALADAYESMTRNRPHRPALSMGAAKAEIRRCRGTQFDPDVVDVFLGLSTPRLRWVRSPLGLLGARATASGRRLTIGRRSPVDPGAAADPGAGGAGESARDVDAAGDVAGAPGIAGAGDRPGRQGWWGPGATVLPTPAERAIPAQSVGLRRGAADPVTRATTVRTPPSPAPDLGEAFGAGADPDLTTDLTADLTADAASRGGTARGVTVPPPRAHQEDLPAPVLFCRPPPVTDLRAAAFAWVPAAGQEFECSLDDGEWTPVGAATSTTYIDVAGGEHRFAVRAVDLASGLRSAPAVVSWQVTSPRPAPQPSPVGG